jgi:hypothetical protein
VVAIYPQFQHIHCSSRFDRTPAQLEIDLDNWMKTASIVTMTEVGNDRHAAQLAEKGWGYLYVKGAAPGDDCGIAWHKRDWDLVKRFDQRISTIRIPRGKVNAQQWFISVLLRGRAMGHTLLVCVTHMPAHLQGRGGQHWGTWDAHWKIRKAAYQQAMKNYSTHVKALARKHKADAVLVIADWNLNLKLAWVQHYMNVHWGKDYRQAWKRFPTSGGSRFGKQVVPLGAPGKGHGDPIIDGTLYHGVEVAVEPNLMTPVRSSDHRPYREEFIFNHAAGKPIDDGADVAAVGAVTPGPEWWGFGDYIDDEFYEVDDAGIPIYADLYVAVGGEGGEVL